jgi:putative membrane protein
MKNQYPIKSVVKGIYLLGIVTCLSACGSSKPKAEGAEKLSEHQNEAKFENPKDNGADFMVEAAGINLEEIELGKLAEKQGTAADVKELGRMMVEQHTNAYEDLKKLADTKSVIIPSTPTEEAIEVYKKLAEEKKGKDFDKKYCSMMVAGHENAIKKFETCSEKCGDADVKAWATKMLPTLKIHLEHSKACKEANEKHAKM